MANRFETRNRVTLCSCGQSKIQPLCDGAHRALAINRETEGMVRERNMDDTPYRELAARLDELPNGFPPTSDGAELRLLAKLFSLEEASLAAQLRLTLETPAQIAARLGGDPQLLRAQLKAMAGRGLIAAGRAPAGGLGFGLLPFVVGIYEMQVGRMDAELARLFEDYYQHSFRQALQAQPPVHRVIPVNQTRAQRHGGASF